MPGVSFDRAAGFYDATRGYPPGIAEQLRDTLIVQLQLNPQAQIIEPGIGTGRIALPFVQAGYRYTGVDLSKQMMQELLRKLSSGIANSTWRLQLCQGDIMHMPLATGVFDAAILIHILHLVDDWQLVLDEVWRVLKPGGRIVLANDQRLVSDPPTPPDQVLAVWAAVLDELRVPAEQPRSQAVRGLDQRYIEHLRVSGATVERVVLLEYQQEPTTARDIVGKYRDRIFSHCWDLPDAMHSQAIERLETWLATACPHPDQPYSASGRIDAIVAQLPGSDNREH